MTLRNAFQKFSGFCAALALIAFLGTMAHADIFYAVSNYSTGSVGTIRTNGASVTVNANLVNNLGRDGFGYSFVAPDGSPVGLVREYEYGPDDHIMLYDHYAPRGNWQPFFDGRGWASNIHGACSDGRYLYINTYERYDAGSSVQQPGELVRIDMENGYKADKRLPMEEFTKDGVRWHPHGEGLFAIGDYLYVLWSISSHPMPVTYRMSEVWKMTKDFEVVGKAYVGKNTGNLSSGNMAFHNGKLYVAAMGGWQGPGTWGDLYEVDVDTMVSKKILDGHDVVIWTDAAQTKRAAIGMYGVAVAPDGTVFLLGGSYDGSFDEGYNSFYAGIYHTTVERLSKGDCGERITAVSDGGYSWSIMYDKFSDVLWAMTGKNIRMYDRSGKLLREFQPNELGDNVYSVSVIGGGGHTPWTHGGSSVTDEDIGPIDPGELGEALSAAAGGTPAESDRAKFYAPTALTQGEIAEIRTGGLLAGGAAVASLSAATNAKISASRSEVAPLFGAGALDNIASLMVSAENSAVVFRPRFKLDAGSSTFGGESVEVPASLEDFHDAMALRVLFQNGSGVDLSDESAFSGILLMGSHTEVSGAAERAAATNAATSIVTTKPRIVIVDGPAPAEAQFSDGKGAGARISGDYLFIYDGDEDGTAYAVTAIVKWSADGGKEEEKPNEAGGSGGGGGCSSGGFIPAMTLLFALLCALRVRKKRNGYDEKNFLSPARSLFCGVRTSFTR